MIYDRTEEDVKQAIEIRKNKVQKHLSLTQNEINTLERGTITINTLNRIENKTQELYEKLFESLYYLPKITVKNWNYQDVFKNSDFQRIVKNIAELRNAYFVYDYTPEIPEARYHFENINGMEQNLDNIETIYNDMIQKIRNTRQCGSFYCGGD